MTSCNEQRLKADIKPGGHCPTLGKKEGKQTGGRHPKPRHINLKRMWGPLWGDYSLFLEYIPERQLPWRHLSGNTGIVQCHFPLLPFIINIESPVGNSTAQTLAA